MTHSYRISEQASFTIQEIQLMLAKKLKKRISKQLIIDKAVQALQEKMENVIEPKQGDLE
ncbi:hypothetical protein TH61_16305 [Rufibacter sp. DG15C]|uniref:hypothetical protein n=1 Tax=Rufibacter sp. DG15C TaxID=1379909 RepID=UPI00078D19BA|nr:hypothetical protein [Rufibacter sp. DG15C]AMM52439.1 hypothetical protein TH61_16305 [Rufibacter sp. DG15C]